MISGTVTLANSRLSLVDGTAFVDFSAAGTLTPYLNGKLTLTDSAGKKATAQIVSAGTGETYLEKVTNGGFNTDTNGWYIARATGASVAGGQDGNCLELTWASGTYQTVGEAVLTGGALYTASAYIKSGTYGPVTVSLQTNGVQIKAKASTSSWVQLSGKATAIPTDTGAILLSYLTSAGTVLIDEISFLQVLTPSTTGVVTSAWTIATGFNYNDASGYTYEIALPRFKKSKFISQYNYFYRRNR